MKITEYLDKVIKKDHTVSESKKCRTVFAMLLFRSCIYSFKIFYKQVGYAEILF